MYTAAAAEEQIKDQNQSSSKGRLTSGFGLSNSKRWTPDLTNLLTEIVWQTKPNYHASWEEDAVAPKGNSLDLSLYFANLMLNYLIFRCRSGLSPQTS
jgi:hypothetical protein